MPTVEILPFAEGGGANVESQAAYAGSGHQTSGFSVGIADPTQANKVWRQSTFMAAALANAVSQILGVDVLDDANLAGLVTKVIQAMAAAVVKVVNVPFSATPVFDCGGGAMIVLFKLPLTGNVTSSTLTNKAEGQTIIFALQEDATGGRTFVPPPGAPIGDISTAANITNVQSFVVAFNSLCPIGPLINL